MKKEVLVAAVILFGIAGIAVAAQEGDLSR